MHTPVLWPRYVVAGILAVACACAPRRPPLTTGATTAPESAGEGHALTGVVRDARTDALLAAASVRILADSRSDARAARGATTDGQGRYRLAPVSPGSYRVVIQRAGYYADTVRVQVGACGAMVQSGRSVTYCEDRRNFYIIPTARF